MVAMPQLVLLAALLAALLAIAGAVPTVPKAKGDGEVDKRWFKKWRGERPGLEKGENHFHAPRPVDFDVEKAFNRLPVTEKMLVQWEQEEDQPVASFAYTVALALGGVAGLPERRTSGFPSKVTVHAIGAAKYREARIEDTFGALCQVVKLNPALSDITEIDVVLVGPTLSLGPTKDAAPVVVEAAGCRTSVSVFSGGYTDAVLKEFPTPPDVVVGFDVDAYTCSWRKSLLYIIENQLPTVFSFMLPHEPLWVEELLALPGEAFGKASHAECTEDLERQRKFIAKAAQHDAKAAKKSKKKDLDGMSRIEKHHTVAMDELAALMEKGSADDLLDWSPVASSYDISQQLDVFIAPFDEAPLVGNNPFGGKRVTRGVANNGPLPPPKTRTDDDTQGKKAEHEHEHDKNARAIFGHPNSHLFGFLVVAATASDTTAVKAVPSENQKKSVALLHAAKERMKEENRPLISRWTAMDTNRAIREQVPGWTANRSVKNALQQAKGFMKHHKGGKEQREEQETKKGLHGLFGALKDGLFGNTVDAKLKQAQQKVDEDFIAEKATLTEVTGLLPKKHADFELFKKQMLPKMALKGGAKADAAESKLALMA
jgi:hypothetical protein